jgi:hypothetical protein
MQRRTPTSAWSAWREREKSKREARGDSPEKRDERHVPAETPST